MRLKFIAGFGFLLLLIMLIMSGISEKEAVRQNGSVNRKFSVEILRYTWFDSIRNRAVPVALYRPESNDQEHQSVHLVVFNHGYGANYPENYTNYSYLTGFLAQRGFWVLSIQHELPGDSLLPKTGAIQIVRKPFWVRGMKNILFALDQFEKQFPDISISSLDCVGHSNGGDMSVYTAIAYPGLFRNVITLDHLRVPIPVFTLTAFSTLRSNDMKPDPGVIPERSICKKSHIRVYDLKKTGHNAMNNEGTRKQHREIEKRVFDILKD